MHLIVHDLPHACGLLPMDSLPESMLFHHFTGCLARIVLRLVLVVSLHLVCRCHQVSKELVLHKVVSHQDSECHDQLKVTTDISQQCQELVRISAIDVLL